MNVHVVRSCPYWLDEDVWLVDLTNEGFTRLLGEDGCPCEPCMAVLTSPPMLREDGGDDGRMIWHIHCLLRQSLRSALSTAGYEQVDTDGWTAIYRGPSATVTVEWNRNWRAGT